MHEPCVFRSGTRGSSGQRQRCPAPVQRSSGRPSSHPSIQAFAHAACYARPGLLVGRTVVVEPGQRGLQMAPARGLVISVRSKSGDGREVATNGPPCLHRPTTRRSAVAISHFSPTSGATMFVPSCARCSAQVTTVRRLLTWRERERNTQRDSADVPGRHGNTLV